MAPWSVYIVRCADGTLYTGIATDVRRRIAEHARRASRGAKYLRGRGPLRLVFVKALGPRSLALRVERRIKMLSKARKEALIAEGRLGVRLSGGRQAGVRSHRDAAASASPSFESLSR
jgi:putative endonuclease